MTDLRDELERIADRAPNVDVSPDLYARARRSAVRARVLTVAAAAPCLALIIGLVASRPWHVDAGPQPADAHHHLPAVVPDRIYAPDDEAALPLDRVQKPDPMSFPVVAAYVLDGAKPAAVLIHGDGSYGRVTLPGLAVGIQTGNSQAFALSPDGRRLAYYGRGPGHTTSITIVTFGDFDETGGSYGSHPNNIGGELGALATSLAWSHDGQSLVWTGQPITSWSHGLHFSSHQIAGVLDIGAGPRMLPKVAGGWRGAGVCDGGTAVTVNEKGTWSSSGGPATRIGPGKGGVLATGCPNGSAASVLSRDVSNADGGPQGVLGWSADGFPVAKSATFDRNLNVTGWKVSMLGSGLDGPAAKADTAATRLTLATGLMTRDHPTASLPRPGWATHSSAPWWRMGAGLATGAVLAELLHRLWRRRRDAKGSP